MLIMPSGNRGIRIGYLAGRYPGQLGHLYSPGDQRGPYSFLPYALDNGRFAAHQTGKEWNERAWLDMLEWAKMSGQRPLWAIVPDVVGDKAETLKAWRTYAPILARYNWPLACAVQDGMTPADVPADAALVFVGGSTAWKWRTAEMWCSEFRETHIGRVNTWKNLIRLTNGEPVASMVRVGCLAARPAARTWKRTSKASATSN